MKVCFHNPKTAEAEIMHSTGYGPFCTLDFKSDDGEVTLFLRAHQMDAARAIAAIFNGDVEILSALIGGDSDMSDAIACDLIGKDLDEALRERREAEDAA